MKMLLLASAVLLAGSFGCAEHCPSPEVAWPVSPPVQNGSEPRASALLAGALSAYEARSTYRDQGTIVSTIRTRDDRGVRIEYFDTLFVRGVGLRFRFYNERRELTYAVWSFGPTTKLWFLGTPSTTTLPLALAGVTGVTHGVAPIIPKILLGERSFHSFPPRLAGIEASCGRCEILTWQDRRGSHESVTLDEDLNLFRRFESHDVLRHAGDGGPASDVYVIYEPLPEMGNRASLIEELSVEPW